MPKLIRLTTSPIAFKYLLKGQMKYMHENGFDVIMISSDGPEVKDVLANEECPHIAVPMTRAITPFKDLKSIAALVRVFKNEKPDIVHSHTPKAGLLSMIASRIAAVPIRLHSNSGTPLSTATGFKKQIFKITEKLTASNSTLILPNSLSLLNFLKESRICPPSKMKLLGRGSTNGIDCEFFSKQSVPQDQVNTLKGKINYDPQKFYFLFAGRIMTSKGIVELINAFVRVRKQFLQAELILAGNIEEHMDIVPEGTLEIINSNKSIHPLGWIEDIRIPMSVAGCLVHPSHREGFPNVLLQAGAMELPVICSDCIGNVDIISDGKTGLMFPVGDTDALSIHMGTVLHDPSLMKKMSDALYELTITHFSRNSVQSNILSLYRQLLNKPC